MVMEYKYGLYYKMIGAADVLIAKFITCSEAERERAVLESAFTDWEIKFASIVIKRLITDD